MPSHPDSMRIDPMDRRTFLTSIAAAGLGRTTSLGIGRSLGAAPGGESRLPAFPLRVSDNRRFLVDRDGVPFLYHADTAWRAIQRLNLDEACFYLDDRRAKGFNAVHLHAINKEKEGDADRRGDRPFEPADDPTRPVEPYWRHAEAVVRAASDRGFCVGLSSCWFGYGGSGWRKHLNAANAPTYGRFLGERFRQFANILWIHGGDNDPGDKADVIRALVGAIKAVAPAHLHTVHNAAEHPSARFFDRDDWLDVNLAYTYRHAYMQVLNESARNGPARPVVLGETGYEKEANTGFPWTPYLVRRQAYWALTSGACGQAAGSATVWHFGPGWREALPMESARQMVHVKALFAPRPWWRLVPDRDRTLLLDGSGTFGQADYATAARADDGRSALIYLPSPRTIAIDLARLSASRIAARWYSPRDGQTYDGENLATAGPFAEHAGGGRASFTPPTSGREDDWVLVLDDAAG